MSGLVDKYGRPLKSDPTIVNKKASPPKLGEAFGAWAGRDIDYMTLPGGGVVQFDLSKLTLNDYRAMRDHYQVNASLAVQMFMQHQSDWHIECEDKKIAEHCEINLREIWTPLNRAMSTSNWAGYAPNALNWENDANSRTIQLVKVKDLIPEECSVNWKEVDGWSPPGRPAPKHKVYDGIKQRGYPYTIPVDNSFWFPMLMENGDYYGKKLLRPAFTSWFFSILVHLFANRYYERFGEPVPIGRAPFDDAIDIGDNSVPGNVYMLKVLQDLRSRSVVVLPNDRQQDMGTGKQSYDYDIEYLESQMRGADFERYMTRLDEEISLALFTPILLLRTADVGSYNLGVGHMQMYLWMLNAMNGDRKVYIDKYILNRMVDFNFSPNAPRAKIIYRKLGNQQGEILKDMITQLMAKDKIKPDINELGQLSGMTLTEIAESTESTDGDPTSDGDDDRDRADGNDGTGRARGKSPAPPARTGNESLTEIVNRVQSQVANAAKRSTDNTVGGRNPLKINMGFKRRIADEIGSGNADKLYAFMDGYTTDMLMTNLTEDQFMRGFEFALKNRYNELKD